MEYLTVSNTLVLPQTLVSRTPTCWHKKELWFEQEEHDRHFDMNCEQALIAEGIGEHKCPTIAEWAAFTIAGGIVATLTGKYILPPDPEPWDWAGRMEDYIWEMLWQAVQENSDALNRMFIAVMLRRFLPREYYAPPDRPYRISNFARRWESLEYPDGIMHSVGNLRLEHLQKGREVLALLPDEIKNSIKQIAQHVPIMLQIAIERIRKTYRW